MECDRAPRDGVVAALNEATIVGPRAGDDRTRVDLLVPVLPLPAAGPPDPDTRRVVGLSGASRVQVLLRPESEQGYGQVVDLVNLDAVWAEAMYGRTILDTLPPTVKTWWSGEYGV